MAPWHRRRFEGARTGFLAKNERINGEDKMREFRSSVIYYQGTRMKACANDSDSACVPCANDDNESKGRIHIVISREEHPSTQLIQELELLRLHAEQSSLPNFQSFRYYSKGRCSDELGRRTCSLGVL